MRNWKQLNKGADMRGTTERKIKVEFDVSRSSRDDIRIYLQDEASRVTFCELRMTPAEFAMSITGMSGTIATGYVRGLEHVGKKKISETRTIECPLTDYDRAKTEAWLAEHGKEDGWVVDNYLGSQTSVVNKGGKKFLNYRVHKWVDVE